MSLNLDLPSQLSPIRRAKLYLPGLLKHPLRTHLSCSMIRSSENAVSVSKDKTESGYICQNFVGTQYCCVLILYPIAPPDPRFPIAKFCCFYAGLPIYGNG